MLCAEEDDSLTAEDRAIARFQKQRMKELKGAYDPLFAATLALPVAKSKCPLCSKSASLLLKSGAARQHWAREACPP
jgi:hypothetical protein